MTPALGKMMDSIGSGGWENHCSMADERMGTSIVTLFLSSFITVLSFL
jgi:hypothetical protein